MGVSFAIVYVVVEKSNVTGIVKTFLVDTTCCMYVNVFYVGVIYAMMYRCISQKTLRM